MGLMRKLMMGCIPGERILVNTTEEHTSLTSMDTPIKIKVGASYSISWTGAMPTAGSYIYPFKIYGGYGVVSDMCDIKFRKRGSNIEIQASFFDTNVAYINLEWVETATLEQRIFINSSSVEDNIVYYNVKVEFYINGERKRTTSGIRNSKDVGDGLRYYENLAGTFVIKKLS